MGCWCIVVTVGRTKAAISKAHYRILSTIAKTGSTKAMFFEEDEIDALFKLRPRLIKLVPGHIEAVVEITPEGITALKKSGFVS